MPVAHPLMAWPLSRDRDRWPDRHHMMARSAWDTDRLGSIERDSGCTSTSIVARFLLELLGFGVMRAVIN